MDTAEQKDTRAEWLAKRAGDVTSTEISALFDLSPYMTRYELWHRKKNRLIVDGETSERMKWGLRLQESIAQGIAEDQGWMIRRMDEYMRLPDLRMGASFDYAIGDDGILEVKNVDSLIFKEGWIEDGDGLEAPPHIELQVQHQLATSNRKWAVIGALIGGNRVVLIRRERSESIIEAIRGRVAEFWASIEVGQEPEPLWERDATFIAKLYGYAEPGKVIDGDDEISQLAAEYRSISQEQKKTEAIRDGLKARLLTKMGDAEKVKGEKYTISAGLVGPAHVEYDRAGYRAFRIVWKRKGEQKGE